MLIFIDSPTSTWSRYLRLSLKQNLQRMEQIPTLYLIQLRIYILSRMRRMESCRAPKRKTPRLDDGIVRIDRRTVKTKSDVSILPARRKKSPVHVSSQVTESSVGRYPDTQPIAPATLSVSHQDDTSSPPPVNIKRPATRSAGPAIRKVSHDNS